MFLKTLYPNPHKNSFSKVIDFDTDWVKLEWDKPEFDGGSTVTGYIIEKRDKQFQKWEVCTRSEGETPVCKVSNLIEGSIYEFRVRAVNKAGESEPSDPSIPHRYIFFKFKIGCIDFTIFKLKCTI